MVAHLQLETKSSRDWAFTPVPTGLLRRKCACGTQTAGGECEECGKKKQALQRKASNRSQSSEVPPIVHEVLRTPGQSLDSATRSFMEPRFGHDFSGVRVHTDDKAAESARAVDGLAYSVGRDVVFGAGQYAPGAPAGRKLLTHELAHVVQQGAVRWSGGALRIGAADSPHEQEADRVSAGGDTATSSSLGGATLQRQPAGGGGPEMPKDAGGLFLRLGENGRIEVLARSPGLPTVGSLGFGFRCEGGKCQPVGGQDPSDVGNRTYTPQEAIDLLRGKKPGATTLADKCPADRQISGLGLCCPIGMSWDAQSFSCVSATPNLCLPAQMTPSGLCCPMGEQWNFLHRRCEAAGTGTTFPTLPPLNAPPLTLKKPRSRFGTIASSTFDDFRTDDATVPAKHSAALDHLASLLNIYWEVEVHIEGHTDSTADGAHNKKLSDRRAQAIRDELIARNVSDPARLKIKGLGEEQPRVAPERGDADRAANRRVEVWYHILPTQGLGQGEE